MAARGARQPAGVPGEGGRGVRPRLLLHFARSQPDVKQSARSPALFGALLLLAGGGAGSPPTVARTPEASRAVPAPPVVAAQDPTAAAPAAVPPDGAVLYGNWPASAVAGSDVCAGCHGDIADAQAEHPMARTAAPLTPANAGRWFGEARLGAPSAWRSGPTGSVRPTWRRVDGGVALAGTGAAAAVAAVFGSGLRGETPVSFEGGGRMRELRLSWSHGLGAWIETPGSEDDADPLGDVDPPALTVECIACHATTVRWERGVPDAAASEWGVRCERCHGPGAAHAAGWEEGAPRAIFNPGALASDAQVRFCAQCHRQPTDFEPLEVLRRDRSLARHAGASLMMSACYRESAAAGPVACLECHDPHQRDADVGARARASCLRCHEDPAGEHLYERVSAASDCVRCHMPVREEVFPGAAFTDHWIRVDGTPPAPDSPAAARDRVWLRDLHEHRLAEAADTPRHASRLRIGLGELLAAEGTNDAAFEALDEGIAGEPRYQDLLKAAALYRVGARFARAEEALARATALEPDAAQAFFDLGDLRIERGDAANAVAVLETANRLQPASPVILARLAEAYRTASRLDEARSAALAAIGTDRDRPEAWLALGRVHRARRSVGEAAAALREANRLAPRWPPALEALARLLALDPDEAVRDAETARELADRWAAMDGYGNPASLEVLAAAAAAAGDFDFAVRTAERALVRAREDELDELGATIADRLVAYREGRLLFETVPRTRQDRQ